VEVNSRCAIGLLDPMTFLTVMGASLSRNREDKQIARQTGFTVAEVQEWRQLFMVLLQLYF